MHSNYTLNLGFCISLRLLEEQWANVVFAQSHGLSRALEPLVRDNETESPRQLWLFTTISSPILPKQSRTVATAPSPFLDVKALCIDKGQQRRGYELNNEL